MPGDLEYGVPVERNQRTQVQYARLNAVFCVNDLVGFGVQDAAYRLGIAVPDDLWVAGYDDIPMASWDRIDLTSVRQPVEQMAAYAVERLVRRIKDSDEPAGHRRFPAELVVRGSTGEAAPGDVAVS